MRDATTGDPEGGKLPLPIIPIASAVGFGLNAVYNVGKARDNRQFWNDYYRNTGFAPRYPYRAGANDWMRNDMYLMAGFQGAYGKSSRYVKRYYR